MSRLGPLLLSPRAQRAELWSTKDCIGNKSREIVNIGDIAYMK